MSTIALFLDVDGVLNQYRVSERIRRFKIGYDYTFQPFKKKVLRLSKLVKKYNIDVYVFSAWTEDDLQKYLPFRLKGDTKKWISHMNEVSESYKHSIVIDDEISTIATHGCKGEDVRLNANIVKYQPHSSYGLVLKDFKNIDKILKGTV
jgi:predicted PilT family ATPase